MQKMYETAVIVDAMIPDDAIASEFDAISDRINEHGKLLKLDKWGKRKMAYPIKKESRGQYTYFVYTGKGEVVHEIERNLRLHEHVLRFLTVNLGQEFDSSKFQKQRSDVHAAAKRREEEREARREERNAERRGYGDDRGDYRRHDLDDSDEISMGAVEGEEE